MSRTRKADRFPTITYVWDDLSNFDWNRRDREVYTALFFKSFQKKDDDGYEVWEAKVSLRQLQKSTGYKNRTDILESLDKLDKLGLIIRKNTAENEHKKSVYIVKHFPKREII